MICKENKYYLYLGRLYEGKQFNNFIPSLLKKRIFKDIIFIYTI